MKLFDFEGWELTQENLKEILSYDPMTGKFHWLVKPASRTYIGDRAGSLDSNGYRVIKIAGQSYKAHRLAWFYVHGEWPMLDLDFINRYTDDNRMKNLREATKSQNGGNSLARHDGLKGAYWHKRERVWFSAIDIDGKQVFLGNYDTEREAHLAYCEVAKKKFGEFFYAG